MTREEAIKILNKYDLSFCEIEGNPIPPQDIVEAFDMAIEALQAEAVQGCDGCRNNTRIPQKQCLCCKRYWRDGYERKGGDTE